MTRKSKRLYVELFKVLKELELKPKSISLDFENASISAAEEVWPSSKIEGCFFHFSNAIKKYVNSHCPNLKNAILNDSHPSQHLLTLNKFRALALIPLEFAEEAVQKVINEASAYESGVFEKFIEYFKSYWIRKVGI